MLLADAIEVGFGVFFSVLTLLLTFLERKFAGVQTTSEHFNTAGRDVKTGLTASVIVSQWTWAATLLQSSNVAWNYGITGPFWYASGASIQVLVFGILAIEVKRKAPNAHTFLEMIYARWGKAAHGTFLFFGICTNIIVSSMLLLGGCAVMQAAANIPIVASSFLIPLGTLIYTLVGGLKATFLASYLHTTIIFIGLILFVTIVYGFEFQCTQFSTSAAPGSVVKLPAGTSQCNSLGSAALMWERLRFVNALPTRVGDCNVAGSKAAFCGTLTGRGYHQGPAHASADGNRGGSYLTMMSLPGVLFGIINIVGNFGTVFVDQSYWQSAIAASRLGAQGLPPRRPRLVHHSIRARNFARPRRQRPERRPFRKRRRHRPCPPASATALMGNGGGILMIIMLFMAITSTGSAECIAVASLWAYDCYRQYINKNATGAQILLQSRIVVCVWALVMAIASIVLNAMGLGLGWVYNFMGICIGSAVVPIAMVITNKDLGPKTAIVGAVTGFVAAVIAWLSQAAAQGGTISVATTGLLYAQLAGNCHRLLLHHHGRLPRCPQNFDWDIMVKGISSRR